MKMIKKKFNDEKQPNLVNWQLADFGACSTNQCTQNQI